MRLSVALLTWYLNLVLIWEDVVGTYVPVRGFETYDVLSLAAAIFLTFNLRSRPSGFQTVLYVLVGTISSALLFFYWNFFQTHLNLYMAQDLYRLGLITLGALFANAILSFRISYQTNELLRPTDPLGILNDEDRTRQKAKEEVPPIP